MVVPNYSGEKYYKMESVVNDENLVTAQELLRWNLHFKY